MVSIHHENPVSIVSSGDNVYVSDVLNAHRWYSEILVLKMGMSPGVLSSRYTKSHAAEDGGLTIFRLLPRTGGDNVPGNVQLAFSIPHLDQTVESQRGAGVIFARSRNVIG